MRTRYKRRLPASRKKFSGNTESIRELLRFMGDLEELHEELSPVIDAIRAEPDEAVKTEMIRKAEDQARTGVYILQKLGK